MAAGRSRDLIVAVLAGVALVALAAIGVITALPPEMAQRASSFSPGPAGTKAALLMLQQLGYRVDRSFEPITALAVDPRRTVLVLASPEERASAQDRRAIRRFVADGGVLLATGCGGASFLTSGTLPLDQPSVPKAAVRAREVDPLTTGALQIAMAPECTEVDLGRGYRALYGAGRGVVRVSRTGSGAIVWWAGSTPMTNEAIGDAGNLELVLNAMGRGARRVVWDEYYHGQRRSLWGYVKGTALPWVGLQGLVIGLATATAFSRRRAPIRPRWTPRRHAPMEFVDTMATLYRQAETVRSAVATSGARTRRLMREISGLPSGTPDQRLSSAVAARLSQDPGEIESLLAASAALAADANPTEESSLPIVRRLQQLSAAVLSRAPAPTLRGAAGRVKDREGSIG